MDDPFEQAWDMSISRADFERSLEAAVGAPVRQSAADRWEWGGEERGGRVVLAPLPDLCIALLRLPRHRVNLRLHGYGEAAAAFLRRWELNFRRGGG